MVTKVDNGEIVRRYIRPQRCTAFNEISKVFTENDLNTFIEYSETLNVNSVINDSFASHSRFSVFASSCFRPDELICLAVYLTK